ncbi:hypothetical protein [Dyella sp.]|uniref:hypothetical protein n=1 Tax=Dyella sp. TaxID=1869338 RepID=UPI003F80BA0C
MGRLMDVSDFNPSVARARREEAQRKEAQRKEAQQLNAPGGEAAAAPENLTEEH